MFRWCAYCWKFMGEREPFEDLSTTHGICERCVEADAMSDDDIISRTRPIKDLHVRLHEIATQGRIEQVQDLIACWTQLGLGRIELLVAVMQPALYLVGLEWERGAATSAHEARLTRFCSEAIEVLDAQQKERTKSTWGPPIILFSADGNRHDLGVKMLAFALREAARDVRILPVPPPPDRFSALCDSVQPSVVGVSLALPAHADYVAHLVDAVGARWRRPTIVVGGIACSSLDSLPAGVVRWSASESLSSAAAFFAKVERAER